MVSFAHFILLSSISSSLKFAALIIDSLTLMWVNSFISIPKSLILTPAVFTAMDINQIFLFYKIRKFVSSITIKFIIHFYCLYLL